MKIKYIFCCLFIIIGGSSCNKFLDLKPLDKLSPVNFYETEPQMTAALTGVYDILGRGAVYAYTFPTRFATEADEGYFQSTSRTTGPQFYDLSSSDAEVLGTWSTLYEGISRANVVLANIKKPQMSEVRRNEIEGEALFLRSYYYFLLVTNWGGVPLVLEPVTSVEGNSIGRSTPTEVYEQITQDMIKAETLVGSATKIGFGGRVNKSAVRGVLARVYLYWAGFPLKNTAKYEDAKLWSEKVINDGEAAHRLNPSFEQVFINYAKDLYDVKESIFEVEFATTGIYEHGQIGSWIGIRSSSTTIGTAYGFIGATQRMYQLYKVGDLRRDRAVAPFYYSGDTEVYWTTNQFWGRSPGKWRRAEEVAKPKLAQNTPINYPLLRYSDVLLMFAEAENALNGTTPAAYDAVNKVRRRAFGLDITIVSSVADFTPGLSPDAFLELLKDERSRELCFESMRKYDLIRWGDLADKLNQMQNDILTTAPASYQYSALSAKNFTSRHLLLPIPISEIALNKLLTQNPGW